MKTQSKLQKHKEAQDQPSEEEDQDQNRSEGESDNQEPRDQGESDDEDDKGLKKWDYLEFNGVLFHEPYAANKTKCLYKGQPIELLPEEEELMWYWYQCLGTMYEHNPIFKKNFLAQFAQVFQNKLFENFDFSPLYQYFANSKKEKKPANDLAKQEAKQKKIQEDKRYGLCMVDTFLESIGSFKIQGPALLKGRGDHPKAGSLKTRIVPEKVTINIAENAPVPICPMPGHCWGEIVHKHDVTWLASYKDTEIKKSYKYIYLAPNSSFKWQSDKKKYEKARNLKDKIEDIRKDYREKLQSSDMKNKLLGTTTYLIDTLALRVGNEKSTEEADTFGCCSLRVQHVTIESGDEITLKFLGKDSIEYHKTVKVDPIVRKNLQLFQKGKEPTKDIFDIDAQVLNDYLRGLMDGGLTAKVFRTFNASTTLQKQLSKADLKGLSMEQKKDVYDEANRMVAILCNHQRTVSKKSEESLRRSESDLLTKQKYLEDLVAHYQELKSKKKTSRQSSVAKLQSGKELRLDFPDDKDQTKTLIDRESKKIQRQQKIFKKKDLNKQYATGTSKLNYNDPRITVAWCKKNEVKIEKVFNRTQLSKFFWAMETEQAWEF